MQSRSTMGIEKLSLTNSSPTVKMRPPRKAKESAKLAIKEEIKGTQKSSAKSKERQHHTMPQGMNPAVPAYKPLDVRPLGSETATSPHANAPLTGYPFMNFKRHHTSAVRHLDPARTAPKSPAANSKTSSHVASQKRSAQARRQVSTLSPTPTSTYLSQAALLPSLLLSPQKLLVVLDLNGTLLVRKKATQGLTLRPHLSDFLEYCLAHHSVMVWSSARPANVKRMCGGIFTPQQRKAIVAEWGRERLGLSEDDYNAKVQVYKRLSSIWSDEDLQRKCPSYDSGERWGQHNTVLVDDGVEKGKSECWNLVQVPEFQKLKKAKAGTAEDDILAKVVGWLEEARRWSDVSGFCGAMGKAFTLEGGWTWEWQPGVKAVQAAASALPVQLEPDPTLHDECLDLSSDSDSDGGVRVAEAVSH